MAIREQRLWTPSGDFTAPRRDRKGGVYFSYIPDLLAGRRFTFDGHDAADLADAEREIAALERTATTLADTEALARLLLRAESAASSRIENLTIGSRRLLRADAARQMGETLPDITANEVLANIDAMEYALSAVDASRNISATDLLESHRRLLEPTAYARFGGVVRDVQNWIGGSSFNPCSAVFVPPPPESVPGLLEDLCDFCNDDSLPTVAQAAIAHAQFETIHPFVDGNGRVGRALIHMVFRRRGLTSHVSPPISLVLATLSRDYVDGLTATRYVGESSSREAVDGTNRWIATFASASRRAVAEANGFEKRIRDIQSKWLTKLAALRSDATAIKLVSILPGAPVISAATAGKLVGRSLPSTLEGIQRLVTADILRPTIVGKRRGQVYEAHDVIAAFTLLERRLASPAGDTRIAKPIRPVPRL